MTRAARAAPRATARLGDRAGAPMSAVTDALIAVSGVRRLWVSASSSAVQLFAAPRRLRFAGAFECRPSCW